MKINYCLCLISLMISGCASTVELNSIDEAQTRIGDHSATIHLKSDQEYLGEIVQVGDDSVRAVDMETEDTLQFSNQDIEFIKVTNHTLGAVKGFLIGAATLGTYVAIVNSNYDSNVEGEKPLPPIFIAIGAGIGGVFGLAIGGLIGHHYTYILPEDSVNVGIEKTLFAQDSIRDIVYLKNGSIIKGFIIIDTTTNAVVRIQTADRSMFVCNVSDVEKIEKEIFIQTPSPDICDTLQTIDKGRFRLELQTGLKSSLSNYYDEVNKYPENWMIGIGAIYSFKSGYDVGASISYCRLKYDMSRDEVETMSTINDGIPRMYGLSLFCRSYSSPLKKLPVVYYLARLEYNYIIIPDKYLTYSYGVTYKTSSIKGPSGFFSVGGGVIIPIADVVRLLPEIYMSLGNGLFWGYGFTVDVKL